MSSSSHPTDSSGESRPTEDLPPHSADDAASTTCAPHLTRHERQIGQYHLLDIIGEGGMGIVYKAEQRHPIRRTVALKLTKLELDSGQVIARFESERQALALMNHPNIARVLDAGTTPTGRPYFVMEYVPGESITRFCDRDNYTIRQRLELFKQACDAVQHAHQKAIIHRDLKPGNILVTVQDGKPVVKVIDFGLAKATAQQLTDRTLFTEAGQLLGTREYMSPEQADLVGLDVDTRTDVYSLGVILYELLIGALPFKELRTANFAEIQRIICEVEPPRPSTRLSSLGPDAEDVARKRQTDLALLGRQLRSDLEWIPLKAMRKERSRRYSTVAELAQDVDNYLDHKPLLAAPESRVYRFRKLVRRNKGLVTAVTAVLLVLIAGIVGTSLGLVGQSRQRALAQREAENARIEAARQKAVSDFLDQMLRAADPDRLLGDKVTVLQASQEALKRLDAGDMKDQPLIEASVRGTIGRTLMSLSRYDDATPVLEKALHISRTFLPEGHPALATSLNDLGALYLLTGRLDQAEPLYREALDILRGNLPARDPQIAAALNDLAGLLQAQGKLAEAEALFRESLDIFRHTKPRTDPSLASSLSNLARALEAQGKFDQAEPLYQEALEICRKVHSPRHPSVAIVLDNLAGLRFAQGNYHAAELLAREALEIRRVVLPEDHIETAHNLGNLAMLVQAQEKLAEAQPLFAEALEIYRKRLPADHPDIARCLNNIAALRHAQGDLADAERLYREALQIWQRTLPPEHPTIAHALNNLASILVAQDKLDEAEPLCRESMRIRRKILAPGDPQLANSLLAMGNLLRRQGKLTEAELLLVESLEIRRKALPTNHPFTATSLENLALLRQAQGDLVETERLYRQAVEMRRIADGPLAAPTTRAAVALAEVLDDLHRADEADAVRRQYELPAAAATSHPASGPVLP